MTSLSNLGKFGGLGKHTGRHLLVFSTGFCGNPRQLKLKALILDLVVNSVDAGGRRKKKKVVVVVVVSNEEGEKLGEKTLHASSLQNQLADRELGELRGVVIKET